MHLYTRFALRGRDYKKNRGGMKNNPPHFVIIVQYISYRNKKPHILKAKSPCLNQTEHNENVCIQHAYVHKSYTHTYDRSNLSQKKKKMHQSNNKKHAKKRRTKKHKHTRTNTTH